MIVLFPAGGLGNQLFQYAAAKTLSELRGNDEIVIDTEFYNYLGDRKYELNKFKFSRTRLVTEKEKRKIGYRYSKKVILLYQKYIFNNLEMAFKTSDNILENTLCKMGIYVHARYVGDKEIPLSLVNKRNIYLWGYFLRPRFVKSLEKIELKSKNPILEIWENNCSVGEHVCVHIRLDDFVGNDFLDVCTKEYYYSAIKFITKRIKYPIFHVFSDDLESVKKEFNFSAPVIYEKEKNVSLCLMKMSLCKHFILSNSTFSWWACTLSKNNKKIVIVPSHWFKNVEIPFYLYDTSWIKIEP